MEQDYLFLADLLSKFQSSGGFGKALITLILLSPFMAFTACFIAWMRHLTLRRASGAESLPQIEPLRRREGESEANEPERIERERLAAIETQGNEAIPGNQTPMHEETR